MRRLWVFIHRWAGLLTAGFFIVVGVTGSLLAFKSELEHLISPQLYATQRPDAAPLDLATLAGRAESLVPRAQVGSVSFGEPDQVSVSMTPRNDPAAGQPYELGFDQLLLDPWTSDELGRRNWGDISQGRAGSI